MINKLSIGTVQFGMDYGISNSNGEVTQKEVDSILNYAQTNGIGMIDTAYAYGNSQKKIGNSLPLGVDIVTKILDLKNMRSELERSLQDLKINKLYGLLVHQFQKVREDWTLFDAFHALKADGLVQKVGFSINKVEELEQLLEKNVSFDLLQLPYNLFDQRFASYFDELKKRKIEIHARSIFLQGLFFMPQEKVPTYLTPLKENIQGIQALVKTSGMSIEDMALNFVLMNANIDKVVIGVTSLFELQKNMNAVGNHDKLKSILKDIHALRCDDEQLILPLNWK